MVLDYIMRVEKHTREMREIKLALVTAHILKPFDAFPELDPERNAEDEEEVPDDEEPVTYIFTGHEDPESIEEMEEEIRTLLAESAQGSATFEDFGDWV